MDFLRRHKKIISDVFGLGVLVLSLFVVVFFIWKRCRAEYNGDYTDTLLWANAAVTSGHFYNPDYWYAYFIPFSGIPLMIPIVSAFGLTYFSQQLGMTVFALIFAAALFVFFKAFEHLVLVTDEADIQPRHAAGDGINALVEECRL